jgi:hypothetical protein
MQWQSGDGWCDAWDENVTGKSGICENATAYRGSSWWIFLLEYHFTSGTNHDRPNLAASKACSRTSTPTRPGSIRHSPSLSNMSNSRKQLLTMAAPLKYCTFPPLMSNHYRIYCNENRSHSMPVVGKLARFNYGTRKYSNTAQNSYGHGMKRNVLQTD